MVSTLSQIRCSKARCSRSFSATYATLNGGQSSPVLLIFRADSARVSYWRRAGDRFQGRDGRVAHRYRASCKGDALVGIRSALSAASRRARLGGGQSRACTSSSFWQAGAISLLARSCCPRTPPTTASAVFWKRRCFGRGRPPFHVAAFAKDAIRGHQINFFGLGGKGHQYLATAAERGAASSGIFSAMG